MRRLGRAALFAFPALLASGALAVPAAATGGPQAGSILSISPALADRGELVTIAGKGFGARNVAITVDGVRAAVVSATGSTAAFRVPRLAGPGRVLAAPASTPCSRSSRRRASRARRAASLAA